MRLVNGTIRVTRSTNQPCGGNPPAWIGWLLVIFAFSPLVGIVCGFIFHLKGYPQ